MDGTRYNSGSGDNQTDPRGAAGRPGRAGHVAFSEAAYQLLEQGFEPLPIRSRQKVPAVSRWSKTEINQATIENWCRDHPGCGIGLRTGKLIGLDIDILDDPEEAHRVLKLAEARFGETLVRVGQWPKQLLLYRSETPFPKLKAGKVEVLGQGQQFVAFGIHPVTGSPYYWPKGDTPLDVDLDDLPPITEEMAKAFLAEVSPGPRHEARAARQPGPAFQNIHRENGLVVDGRDSWLSQIAFHAVHDARDAGYAPDAGGVAEVVWARFRDTADLTRPRKDGAVSYGFGDARRKVDDKLKLAREGRLPARDITAPTPDYTPPMLGAEDGRARLGALLQDFCASVVDWHDSRAGDAPTLGIRATVGLGKSRMSREAVLGMMTGLKSRGLPHRVLVFTPSHVLAEETATGWRGSGFRVAVLRGYERMHPTGEPMCRDIAMVRATLAAGLPVQEHACLSKTGARCGFLDACLKQQNRHDVAAADIVVAPYDALFSGLAFEADNIALLLVDEGCWQRAIDASRDLAVEDLATEPLAGMGSGRTGRGPMAAMADLDAYRNRLSKALLRTHDDVSMATALKEAGLSHDDCRHAARLEEWRKRDPGLAPGLASRLRERTFRIANDHQRIDRLARLWTGLADQLQHGPQPGRASQVLAADGKGRHVIETHALKRLHESLRGKPVLHLDATLRPELALSVLPAMPLETIDVAAPHVQVRHVQGSFGKSMICPASGLPEAEMQRRTNRLQECVEYVRWHARRMAHSGVLVVTHQAIEAAFADIPNVETAHFNAVAGLDCYKDVGLLIVIGRPLPQSDAVEMLAHVHLAPVSRSGYIHARSGIHMRTGHARSLSTVRHADAKAEIIRAAICDDELIQVIGRGRGVNRTVENPMEVHVLSDVALPLVYDRLSIWEVEKPDIFQRMLLRGIATDSPADAAALHPEMFGNMEHAKKVLSRELFKGQNPMNTSYREMSLKSAAYRRAGRGRGWQHAWWIDGTEKDVRTHLEAVLGYLAGWRVAS